MRKCNELGKYARHRHQWISIQIPGVRRLARDLHGIKNALSCGTNAICQREVISYIEIYHEACERCKLKELREGTEGGSNSAGRTDAHCARPNTLCSGRHNWPALWLHLLAKVRVNPRALMCYSWPIEQARYAANRISEARPKTKVRRPQSSVLSPELGTSRIMNGAGAAGRMLSNL